MHSHLSFSSSLPTTSLCCSTNALPSRQRLLQEPSSRKYPSNSAEVISFPLSPTPSRSLTRTLSNTPGASHDPTSTIRWWYWEEEVPLGSVFSYVSPHMGMWGRGREGDDTGRLSVTHHWCDVLGCVSTLTYVSVYVRI